MKNLREITPLDTNNCMNCKHFASRQSLYDGDEYEPHDSWKCDHPLAQGDNEDHYVTSEIVCDNHEIDDELEI